MYNGISDKDKIINELNNLIEGVESKQYISTYKISGKSSYLIQKIFYLNSVQFFFDNHIKLLEDKEFIYKNETYYLDEKGKLSVSWKGEQNYFIRVGCDYYKRVAERSPKGHTEIFLKKWNIGEINKDYKSRLFLKQIKKYDSFTNIPENDPNKYKREETAEKGGIKSLLYNIYEPIDLIPIPGEWNYIDILLHNIFDYKNCAGDTLYDFILDYLQILYLNPVRKLPVICLVSIERGTGKSTFLEFLRLIFKENMRILDSDRISSKFNGSYAGKLIIAIDETFIQIEKEAVSNRIKMLTTNDTIPIEQKGVEAQQIYNFSKLIMCSNDEANFMRIDDVENRYCVVRVSSIAKDKTDPNFIEKISKEIPTFLYYLKNRTLHYEEKSRLYFDENLFKTPALEKVVERTEIVLNKYIKNVIKEQFYWQREASIKLSLQSICDLIKENYKYADKIKIQEYLQDKGYKTGNDTTYRYYFDSEIQSETKKGRCYTFNNKDFLTDEEIISMNEK